MSPDNTECLKVANIDCCVLGNNHILDWGRRGLLDTLATLEHLHIKSAGAGRNLAKPARPRCGTSPETVAFGSFRSVA